MRPSDSSPEGMDQPSPEQQLRERIDSMGYLSGTMAVAARFMELSNNPNAGPDDYAKVISADSALSSKLLGLANSSWYGVRNRVIRPSMAVSLLGLGTVRSLALSHCLAQSHGAMGLSAADSRMFWEASLCKAAAARLCTARTDGNLAEEAFTAAMLLDIALPIMYSVAPQAVLGWLRDSRLDWRMRLRREQDLFGFDHAEIGRLIGQRLNLPEPIVDAIAFHHDREKLGKALDQPALVEGLRLASLMPHCLDTWCPADASEAASLLCRDGTDPGCVHKFLDAVQVHFKEICASFEPDNPPAVSLKGLLHATQPDE